MVSDKANFKVFYDGDALTEGSMNVRDLAPALLAFGELLECANKVINGQKSQIYVKIKTFPGGCFGINFEAYQTFIQKAINVLSGPETTATVNLLNLIGINPATVTGAGLFWLVRKAKGRWPKKAKQLENGNVILEFDDNESIEANSNVVALFQDTPTRESLEKTISPLDVDGIDSFSLGTPDGGRIVLVEKSDRAFFAVPSTPDVKLFDDFESTRVMSIQSLSFKDGNKWIMSDGQNQFRVTISDKNFLRSISENEAFAKGDLLKVTVITRQWQTGSGQLKTEYEISKVLEHTRATRLQLPFTD